jgi:Protein of unknown function DUF262
MRYQDIPQMTPWGGYSVDVRWSYLETWLAGFPSACLDPEFQRHYVWTEQQKIRYVEFALRGGRSGKDILWNCPDWNTTAIYDRMAIVDGKQRINAVRQFMRDELAVFGHTRSQIDGRLPTFNASFKMHVNDLVDPADVLQWYLDVNSGGTQHTDDELDRVRRLMEQMRVKP